MKNRTSRRRNQAERERRLGLGIHSQKSSHLDMDELVNFWRFIALP